MIKITITVEDDDQKTTLLNVLGEAEEDGAIDFPFNTEISEDE